MRKTILLFLLIVGIPGLVSDFNIWLRWLNMSWPPGLGTALVVIVVALIVFSFGREKGIKPSGSEFTADQKFELEKIDRERRSAFMSYLNESWPSLVFAAVIVVIVLSLIIGIFISNSDG